MKISELEMKNLLSSQPLAEDNSFIILNYAETDAITPITYKVTLKELSNMMISNHKILSYGDNNTVTSTRYANNNYSSAGNMGQYITSDDRAVLNSAVTDVAYDTTNKRITVAKRNGTAANVVATSSLLNDMNLNITSITNTAGKTVASIGETNGIVSATFQDISILSS
jgi:hypothetical protein